MNSELTSGTGLVARWGLDEGSGTAVDRLDRHRRQRHDHRHRLRLGRRAFNANNAPGGRRRRLLDAAEHGQGRGRAGRPRERHRRRSQPADRDPRDRRQPRHPGPCSERRLHLHRRPAGYNGPDSFTYKANDAHQRLEHGDRLAGRVGNIALAARHPGRTSRSATGQARTSPSSPSRPGSSGPGRASASTTGTGGIASSSRS